MYLEVTQSKDGKLHITNSSRSVELKLEDVQWLQIEDENIDCDKFNKAYNLPK